MKNKFLKILSFIFCLLQSSNIIANELDIKANQVKLNKDNRIIQAEGNVQITDVKKNVIFAEKAEYDKNNELMRSFGETDIITSEKFRIQGKNILYDNKKGIIYSTSETVITDINGNQVYVNMFDYSTSKKMFFSQGNIEVFDNKTNKYSFSEIYIDEKNRKIVGSDVKSFLKDGNFKDNEKNEPRFFANSAFIDDNGVTFQKGIFTTCKNREEEKCPPW